MEQPEIPSSCWCEAGSGTAFPPGSRKQYLSPGPAPTVASYHPLQARLMGKSAPSTTNVMCSISGAHILKRAFPCPLQTPQLLVTRLFIQIPRSHDTCPALPGVHATIFRNVHGSRCSNRPRRSRWRHSTKQALPSIDPNRGSGDVTRLL